MIRHCLVILLTLLFTNTSAQTVKITDTDLIATFNTLPALCQSAEDAWLVCYPKNKTTPSKLYQQQLQQQLNQLWVASSHKSRLLSMIADKYSEESSRYDFSKVKIEKDAALEAALTKMNAAFFSEKDNYLGLVNAASDSAYQQLHGQALAAQLLSIYRQQLPVWIAGTKKQFIAINNLILSRGYAKVLADNNTSHPYFIQLLELKGLMLDRLLMFSRMVEGANQLVALLIDNCKKDPGSCK